MNLYYYMFAFPMLIISNFLIFMSNNSFNMWMIMEINLIAFISLILMNKNSGPELMMMYFLVQTFSSYLFLISMIACQIKVNENFKIIMILCLMNKLGVPPFHFWYLKFMKSLNWNLFFTASTLQKIIPLMILKMQMKSSQMMLLLMILSSVIFLLPPFLALTTQSLKLIFSYSSMIQTSWITILMMSNNKTWLMFFMIYSLTLFPLTNLFKLYNINYMFELNKLPKTFMNFGILSILSMAGLPPFLGVMTKLMFLNEMILMNMFYLNILMMILSTLNFFFYIKIALKWSMMYNLNNKIFNLNNNYLQKLNLYKTTFILNFSIFMMLLYEIF
uniref:NADH-ubiquinone oxidoreductase chain 2 n=1 Tax=Encyrtus sasakii TaxID=1914890 RepID=A0A7S5FR42_9HYME|nr:NADH dehydrogenase subunit 2 [Encyrtus sasakii]QGA47452.1 NADH dehydrogenase subunit 2 [Encyrtus sasakii]